MMDRWSQVAVHGISLRQSACANAESKEDLNKLLKGEELPEHLPYPLEKVNEVLEFVFTHNEAMLYRDITPWIVPSPWHLSLRGKKDMPDYISDEVQADWFKTSTMRGIKPSPGLSIGFLRSAFTREEVDKLENHATPERPFMVTPHLLFPFLICEAKPGLRGIEEADKKNIHAGSIAVRAIVELYKLAYGATSDEVRALDGQILVFTVSYANTQANVYGHFAKIQQDRSAPIHYLRYDAAEYSLTSNEGRDKFKCYNFVLNVYKTHVPKLLKRLQDVIKHLPAPEPRVPIDPYSGGVYSQAGSQGDMQLRELENPRAEAAKQKEADQQWEMEMQLRELETLRAKNKEGEQLLMQMQQQMQQQMEMQMQKMQQMQQQMQQQREQTEMQMQQHQEQMQE